MTKDVDGLLDDIRRKNERRFAFIAGYGAALDDRHDDDVMEISAMSQAGFRGHIRNRFGEYERGDRR